MARVLVVEDDEGDRVLMRTILENAGHEPFFATDGEKGYKRFLHQQDIEVVVTDLEMPNVDGFELITELLSLFPDTPIIVVSGKGKGQLDMASMLGAVITLPKPIESEALIGAVEDALARGGS